MGCMSSREPDQGDWGSMKTYWHSFSPACFLLNMSTSSSALHFDTICLFTASIYIFYHSSNLSLHLLTLLLTQTYTHLCTCLVLGLKTQFPRYLHFHPKSLWSASTHRAIFSLLSWSQVPLTHRCSLGAHLGSAFKEPTCNWGHKSCSWMNDGLLKQSQPRTPSTWDGWMDG